MILTDTCRELRSEEMTRRVYEFTAKMIKGRAVEGASEAISLMKAEIESVHFLTARHLKLCRLRISEALDRQIQAQSEKLQSPARGCQNLARLMR
ncbi:MULTISPECIES: hypothetical protein [Pseudomonas syringae group]|uniref:Uncharacterized protein n=1 Tax=Pseudomonas cannabina TaxID=86840 RepID=A0A3M3KBB1_PSECA|nr:MULTISPECIES: hypothetical protein [Pseudomonas syringae group]MDH4602350.1 hypothetical protein [Pseudomonas syringae pv. papulans]RMN20400.1 hypothetical protein ALQ64_00206 [Pseudomonas cannabina]